jgi:hypothetical protein
MMQFITLLDYFLLPFFLVVLYLIVSFIRNRDYPPGHPWRSYFMTGFTLKIVGAIGIGLIYQYYYGGGDTANYWFHANLINSAFAESTAKWFNLILGIPPWYSGEYSAYISKMLWYDSPPEYTVCSIAAFFGIFTFNCYLLIAVLFGAFAYTGLWAMFKTFASKYPAYTKYIAWCCLYIPSTVMWGSGLFKDTLCMCGLGWMTYGAFRMLINRDFRFRNLFITLLGFLLIARIKLYILLAFIPALALWILFSYSHNIQSRFTRNVVKVMVIFACIGGFAVFSQKFAMELGKYSLENVAKTSYNTNINIAMISGDEGSTYNLGTMDPSIGGMLKKFLPAINVTLFRPYLWETRKVLQFINAIEATMFLWVTIKILFSVGLIRTWKTIAGDPTIQFCLIFTIIFAFAIGLSSGNFGTLSRYRIPCLPFYGIALVLIYYKNKPVKNNILALNFH